MSEKHNSSDHENAPSGEMIRKIGAFVTGSVARIVDILFSSGKK